MDLENIQLCFNKFYNFKQMKKDAKRRARRKQKEFISNAVLEYSHTAIDYGKKYEIEIVFDVYSDKDTAGGGWWDYRIFVVYNEFGEFKDIIVYDDIKNI